MSMSQGYDFGSLYGMADHSAGSPLEPGNYDAVVESAEWGRTKDGTKGAWTIKFRTTTGERAGYPITMTLSVNPVKTDGSPNPAGMGIMFRQLHAMGIPVGPPVGPPGEVPFWQMGMAEPQLADAIKGRPVLLRVVNDNYNDQVRSKVGDIREPRPGAPTQVQQAAPPQQAYGQQPAMPSGYGQPQQGWQPQQPAYGGGGQQQGYSVQQPPQGPTAPGPWQNAQPPQQGPQQVPGAPAWAQPPVPGQGGMGEFTGQGQSFQGYPGQQPPAQAPFGQPGGTQGGYAQQGQGAPGYQQGPVGAPATPGASSPSYGQVPQAQFQPPQNGYGQPQQPPQQPPNQQPQGAPELPPWAQ